MWKADLQEKLIMENRLETAYEEFGLIAGSSWKHEIKLMMLRNLFDELGDDSVALDNMIYERLGMSAEEVIDMYDADDMLH